MNDYDDVVCRTGAEKRRLVEWSLAWLAWGEGRKEEKRKAKKSERAVSGRAVV